MMLSIITVNRNNDKGLERTCQSVICQTYEDFEWLVIDGASNDNSVDVIKKYSHKMAYWVSEPDEGIYNAMNKGIRKAKGDYCLFLNSGDWLISFDSLKRAYSIIDNLEKAEIFYGNCLFSDFTFWEMFHEIYIDHLYLQAAPSHQNTFIKRSLFYDHGFYDENYPTVSDTIFFVKEYWLYHSKFVYINTIISIYSKGGFSNSYKCARQELHEQMRIIMGDKEFNILAMRHKPQELQEKKEIQETKEIQVLNESKKHQKHNINIIKKLIKYLLPYGLVRFIQIYILK